MKTSKSPLIAALLWLVPMFAVSGMTHAQGTP